MDEPSKGSNATFGESRADKLHYEVQQCMVPGNLLFVLLKIFYSFLTVCLDEIWHKNTVLMVLIEIQKLVGMWMNSPYSSLPPSSDSDPHRVAFPG